MYGTDKRLSYDVLLQPPVSIYSIDNYAKIQLRYFQTIYKLVRGGLKDSREMMRRQHSQACLIAIDDFVMKRSPEPKDKLSFWTL